MVNNRCSIKRFGGIPNKHLNIARYSFTYHVRLWREAIIEKSKWIVKDSLQRNDENSRLYYKFISCIISIGYISKNVKSKVMYRNY